MAHTSGSVETPRTAPSRNIFRLRDLFGTRSRTERSEWSSEQRTTFREKLKKLGESLRQNRGTRRAERQNPARSSEQANHISETNRDLLRIHNAELAKLQVKLWSVALTTENGGKAVYYDGEFVGHIEKPVWEITKTYDLLKALSLIPEEDDWTNSTVLSDKNISGRRNQQLRILKEKCKQVMKDTFDTLNPENLKWVNEMLRSNLWIEIGEYIASSSKTPLYKIIYRGNPLADSPLIDYNSGFQRMEIGQIRILGNPTYESILAGIVQEFGDSRKWMSSQTVPIRAALQERAKTLQWSPSK